MADKLGRLLLCNKAADSRVQMVSGKGHRSRAVDGKPRKSILVKFRRVLPFY